MPNKGRPSNPNALRRQTQVNLYLPKDVVKSLKTIAIQNDKHLSQLAREIFELFLKKTDFFSDLE